MEDEPDFPIVVKLINGGLEKLSYLYGTNSHPKFREDHSLSNIYVRICRGNNHQRYCANYSSENVGKGSSNPQGLLIESSDEQYYDEYGLLIKRTHIDFVFTEVQGNGFGTKLIEDCISRAKARGDDVITLNVKKKNDAMNLYESLGFVYNMCEGFGQISMCYFLNPDIGAPFESD